MQAKGVPGSSQTLEQRPGQAAHSSALYPSVQPSAAGTWPTRAFSTIRTAPQLDNELFCVVSQLACSAVLTWALVQEDRETRGPEACSKLAVAVANQGVLDSGNTQPSSLLTGLTQIWHYPAVPVMTCPSCAHLPSLGFDASMWQPSMST